MENIITNELMEKTFLYCWKRLAQKEDAKDLAQEIIVDALLALRSGKEIKNFHALYWTIANNRLCDFYRRKRPSPVNYEEVENVLLAFDTSFDDYISREELDVLSHSLARLAAIHRDIIIRFYLKDQSVKQIAQALGIPTGTVTGRLSDARKNLKETYMNNEKCKRIKNGSVQIVPLRLDYYWHYGDAYCSIISLLDRQILFTCRSEKKTINEIADEVQASPVFVEESVLRMTESRVMYEPTKGKYISDFIFFPESVLQKAGKIAKDTMREMQLVPRYFAILDGMKDAILAEDFYGNDFDWDYLLPYFIVRSEREFCKRYGSDYIRDKYARNLDYRRKADFFIRASWEDEDMVFESPEFGKMESGYPYDTISSSKYGNCELHNTINEFDVHVKGKEYSYADDRLSWLQASNIDLYLDLVANPCMLLNEHQEEIAADFVCKGILQKQEGGALRGTIPVLSFALVEKHLDMWRETLTPLAQEYAQLLYDRQKDLMLPWIRSDLMDPAYWYVFPHYGSLELELVKYGIGKNMIALPDGPKNACMSLVLLNDSFFNSGAGKGTSKGTL